jgi:site-specific recombinase XerD
MRDLITATDRLPASLLAEAEQVQRFIKARHADATRRAYASDVLAFKAWADTHGLPVLPAAPETVAMFISAQAGLGKRPATLQRRLAAIRHLHRESGLLSPTDTDLVSAAMAGIRRTAGTAQRQVAPATADLVERMLLACDEGLQGRRDRALLALGFGGALRRSEIVALNVEDIEVGPAGLKVHLRRSKTDQDGAGQQVAVLDGARLRVKVALADWLAVAGITSGPIFRRMASDPKVGGRVMPAALTDRSVANIVKRRAEQAGLDPQLFSGHSLRAGFLTTAAASGASLFKMMDVSRHKKVDTIRGYIRQAEQFKDHAGSGFM